ncbi:MAG: type III-B CRISPR-associated protein Cas10/Cmr2 [Verrucomicrobiales bacterium]
MNTDERSDLWSRKLLAQFHDPPEKAYDFSRNHIERAKVHALALGLDPGLLSEKDADWNGAAADRFIFPDPGKVRGLGHTEKAPSFRHPVSGEALELPQMEQGEAEGCLSDALPGQKMSDDQKKLFLVWRAWMALAAGQDKGGLLPYLPADTRIPDGSIWNHMSVVSALEGARGDDGKMRPALLMFQLGPVQDFIAQARSTRDLWSGSYLLSWLTAHAIRALTDVLGPDAVIFPNLRGQPLFDWLHRDWLEEAKYRPKGGGESASLWEVLGLSQPNGQEAALTPGLPNRFLAIVPDGWDGSEISAAVQGEWQRIGEAVWTHLQKECPLDEGAKTTWDFQLEHLLQLSWQRWDWRNFEETRKLARDLPGDLGKPAVDLCRAAEAIPEGERDARCYPSDRGRQTLGLLWSAHYQLLSHRLDARRATRDFTAWEGPATARERDALSGKEEALIDDAWLKKAGEHPVLQHYFRSGQRLGAVNLVKRLWHLAYLKPEHDLRLQGSKFDSVLDVAAGAWKAKLDGILRDRQYSWMAFMDFGKIASRLSRTRNWEGRQLNVANERDLIRDIPAEFLVPEGWTPDANESTEDRELLETGSQALSRFLKEARLSPPPPYYAVIALDGDGIGKFLSGEEAPKVGALLTDKAREYFEKIAPDWLQSPRPLSPSYHLGFSEALGNFGLYAARRVVEAHHGQLIYSGGDDVLAMVPADEAIACVEGLRLAFQGDPALSERYSDDFAHAPAPGMVQLHSPATHEPTWPLLVPGPTMTVSAGIVIAHAKTPLQDAVQAAQAAEKRAKRDSDKGGFGRNALALTLMKRSGERIEWGASFEENGGLRLLAKFRELYRRETGGISGGFPSRIAQLLGRFDSVDGEPMTKDLKPLVLREIEWAWDQLDGKKSLASEKDGFFQLLDDYLIHLTSRERPLRDVAHLFATESFLKRQRA